MKLSCKMDHRGRIRLPQEVLAQIGIAVGEQVELHLVSDAIVIKRPRMCCRFCGGLDRLDPQLRICYYCKKLQNFFATME